MTTCATTSDPAGPPVELVLHLPSREALPNQACTTRLCTALVERIQSAQHTIDFAVYGVRGQPDIVDALLAAKARGVRVRGIVDRQLDGSNDYPGTDAFVAALGDVRDDRASDLAAATQARTWWDRGDCAPRPPGTLGPVRCVSIDTGSTCVLSVQATPEAITEKGDLVHDKFFVFDGHAVWTGSTNVSDTCTGGYNANAVVVVDDVTVAGWYTREFEQLWAGRHHRDKPPSGPLVTRLRTGAQVEVFFGPQDDALDRAVRDAVKHARVRIDAAVFFLTHPGLAQDLVDARQRGVQVRVLLDASGASNAYSMHSVLRAAGVDVAVEDRGGKLHTKALAADGHVLVVGSMNWTAAGSERNDENTLRFDDPTLARQFHTWFDAAWADAGASWHRGRPAPESLVSGTACHDSVDNDHDGGTDGADAGCVSEPPVVDPALKPAAGWVEVVARPYEGCAGVWRK